MAHIDIDTNRNKDLTVFSVTGSVQSDEAIDKISDSYKKNLTKLILWNLRGISDYSVTPTDLEKIAKIIPQFIGRRPDGKTAFVVNKEDLGYGVLYEGITKMEHLPYEYRTFFSEEEALEWLND